MKRTLLIIVLLLATSGSSLAAGKSLNILDQINPAWQRLDELTQSYLTDEQQKDMQQLAFAAAVANICSGFKVDKDKFIAAFQEFDLQKEQTPSAEGQVQRRDKLLVAYGIATGLFSAEGLLVKEQFCDSAQELRTNSTVTYWEPAQ